MITELRAIGARSIMAIVVAAIAGVALWQAGVVNAEYWVQLSPWVPFLAGGFAVLAGTLVFRFWRLGERSEYYLRWGERLPFAAEIGLGGKLLVGHAAYVDVCELPRAVALVLYVAAFSCIALIAITNRGIALLAEAPGVFTRPDRDLCPEPGAATDAKPAELEPRYKAGCKLVQRAYALGYAKSLGSCAPDRPAETEAVEVCRKRQYDEPYLHYAWRLIDAQLAEKPGRRDAPGALEHFGDQLDHLPALVGGALDAVAMKPRSSHHLFVNLPDPHPTLGDRARIALDHGACGAKLARAPRFPKMDADALGPSKLVEHVIGQLLFNPTYLPVVADCKEVTIHWDAPDDACARIAAEPEAALAELGVLANIRDVLGLRARRAELAALGVHQTPGELAAPQRIASVQCLIVGAAGELVARDVVLDGVKLAAREARTPILGADGATQIRLYKQLAELFTESFGYGRLTSNQAIDARPAEANLAAVFREPAFLLAKAELLRDADLFLGNDWLVERPDLLDIYPYHLHLQNFIEIFRRQYLQRRGRL